VSNSPTCTTETTFVPPYNLCFLQTAQFGCSGHGVSLCVSLSFIILGLEWKDEMAASCTLNSKLAVVSPQAVWISKEHMTCSDLKEIPSISFPCCQSCAVLYAILSRSSLWPTCVLQYFACLGLLGIPRLGPDFFLNPIFSYAGLYVNHCLVSPEHNSELTTKFTNDKGNSV
jgi:hypothetical protein